VLDRLNERLDTTRTALVLAGAEAGIVARWAGDHGVARMLDGVHAVPGACLAEGHAGTNGLGTALELDRPVVISGAEHFAERYQEFTCAGVPIHHPRRGDRLGVLTLVCRYRDSNRLMVPIVLEAVDHICDRLLAGAGDEPRLVSAVGRPLVAVPTPPRPPAPNGAQAGPPRGLGRLGGASRAWQQVLALARRHVGFDLPVLVEGPSGVGKVELLRAMWEESGRSGVVEVADAALLPLEGLGDFLARLRRSLNRPDGLLVLRHAELLDAPAARAVGALVDATPPGRVALAATIGTSCRASDGDGAAERAALHDRLGLVHLHLAPLAERRDDVVPLVGLLAGASRHRFRPDALDALARADWPGNVRQLRAVVSSTCASRPVGDLEVADLPAEVVRRRGVGLTQMESAELAAILAGLRDAGGNKAEAALRLGISRSTLYRKLRAYGIDT
jgi:transcriptional regulator of acetoin/glycerol metabolism